jgi:hypothetical protein
MTAETKPFQRKNRKERGDGYFTATAPTVAILKRVKYIIPNNIMYILCQLNRVKIIEHGWVHDVANIILHTCESHLEYFDN